jgi:tetratricopeptide (TPR) repeat protein
MSKSDLYRSIIKFLFVLFIAGPHRLSGQIYLGGDYKYSKYLQILSVQEDSLKCQQLIDHACIASDSLGDFDFSFLIFEKVNTILSHANIPSLRYRLYFNWGKRYFLRGNHEEADKLLTKALSLETFSEDTVLAPKILLAAGANKFALREYKKALAYFNEALDLYAKLKDEIGKARVYNNTAHVYAMSGDFVQSDKLLDKAARLFLKNNMRKDYLSTFDARGKYRMMQGDYVNGKVEFLRYLTHLNLKGDNAAFLYITTLLSIGKSYASLKNWDSCFHFTNRAKTLKDSLNLSARLNNIYYVDLGYCYDKKNEPKAAIYCYKESLKFQSGFSDIQELYDQIASLYQSIGQCDSALSYKTKGNELANSIYKLEFKEQLNFEQRRLKLLENSYQDQLQSIAREQILDNLKKRNTLLFSTTVVLLSISLLLFFFFRQYRLRVGKEHLQSELDFLKSQLNPHFLFNSINNVYVLLNDDKDTAAHFLLKFSDLLRYQLYDCNVKAIPLQKELLFLENYIELEKIRYSHRIKIGYNFPNSDFRNLVIAPLLLQPFIENAFKHTPKNKKDASFIEIKIAVSGNEILFEVVNHVDENYPSILPGGIGLENVKRRLKLIYRGKHNLKIDSQADYYKVTLNIQLNK